MNTTVINKMKTLSILTILCLCIGGTYLIAQSPIPAKEEIVKPSVPEKRYSSYWVRNFQARASSQTEGTFYIELLPYNAVTGEIDQSSPKELSGDLWKLMEGSQASALAMGSVFQAVPEIEAWIDSLAERAAKEAEEKAKEAEDKEKEVEEIIVDPKEE